MRNVFLLGMSTFAAVMLGSAVQAADLPRKAPPPVAPAMYNWTGFYIGLHLGGAWADRDGRHRFDKEHNNHCVWGAEPLICFDDNGHGDSNGSFIAGGQIGFNYQIGQWVWGVEGQVSWVDHGDDHACGFFTRESGESVVRDHLFRCRNGGDWIATVAARLGVAFGATGNWLLYVKGGGAFADAGLDVRLRHDCSIIVSNCDQFVFNGNGDDTRTGWMVGAGLEFGASGGWSWKIEYNYMDFGSDDRRFVHDLITCEGCRVTHDFNIDHQVHVVKFGINYRFGPAPAPVAARY